MPLPNPKKDEEKNDFMNRCMSDATMNKEFKDNKQRVAVCMAQYDRKDEIVAQEKKQLRSGNNGWRHAALLADGLYYFGGCRPAFFSYAARNQKIPKYHASSVCQLADRYARRTDTSEYAGTYPDGHLLHSGR